MVTQQLLKKLKKLEKLEKLPSGFTLIEVIVTLTILGFIVVIVFGAFSLCLSAWERGEATKEEYQEIRNVSQLLSRQIKSAVPYKAKTEKAEGDYLAFEGNTHSIRFVSALSIKTRQPEGFVHSIYEYQEDESRLVLFEQRVLQKGFFERDVEGDETITLLEGISDVRFEFYGSKDDDEAEDWFEEWSAKEKKKLPKAVRVTIDSEKKKKRSQGEPFTFVASIRAFQFEDLRRRSGRTSFVPQPGQ